MIWFLLFSLLSGVLELGSVWHAWKEGFSITVVLLFALLYQLGNLLFVPRLATRRHVTALGTGGMILLGMNLFLDSLVLLGIEITIASLCIQASRSKCKSQCPAWLKRAFRIAGFLFAPIFIVLPQFTVGLCLCSAMAAALSGRQEAPPLASDGRKPVRFSSVMLFHQLHYFTYAYIMPINIAALTGSIMAGTVSFALTWVVYLLPQTLAERYGNISYRKLFFMGHSFLALVMAGLSFALSTGSIGAPLAFWMLTGLGGGTVFCIKHLTRRYREMDMTFSENLGHVLGPMAAILAARVFPGSEAVVLTAGSCIFVCLTLFSAIIVIGKEREEHE